MDGYEVLDYLDSSSKRIAYRARNVSKRRIEQLQILPDSLRSDPERSARFIRESRILTTIQHPNILACHGVLELAGQLVISVEAIEAVSLADRLELGPMDIEEAVRTILQVISAVGAAHAAGVVHREISLDNILITPDNIVKLTGFSAAKSAVDPNVTRRGTLIGSVAYTAPEVFQGHAGLDPRIDIYAIGCVFYALVAGRPPFLQTNEFELMMAHLREAPAPPSSLNSSVNHVLDAVILKSLEKHADNRYQSAGEFYHCILNPGMVYVAPPLAAPRPQPAPTPATNLPVPAHPGSTASAIALLTGLLAILVVIWLLLRNAVIGP